MNIEKIGKFIKELRNEKNISQNELSEEMHVTRQAISNWENGKAIPDSDILLLLSSYFEVSINEILSGERNTSDSNLQDITLQLIDENNSKKRKIKRILFTSTILITSLLVFFLGYYFINNYNSIKVYSVKGQSENYKTYNGIFVATRNKIYLRLGRIKHYGNKNIDKINRIQLFYLNDKKEKVSIIEDNKTDILLDEDFGYKEYFYNTNLNNVLNNMYIEITYNEKEKEIIKLEFDEKFKNNYLFKKFEKQKVIKDDITPETILKKDRQLEELLSYEKAKVDELMKKRKLLDTETKTNDNQPEQIENIVYINSEKTIVQEYIEEPKEDIISQDKSIIESTILEEDYSNEDNQEEEKEVISVEELVDKIKEKGTYEFGMYTCEFINENIIYSIMYTDNIISIDKTYDNVIEDYQIFLDFNGYGYKKYVDYEEVDSIEANNIDLEIIKDAMLLFEKM